MKINTSIICIVLIQMFSIEMLAQSEWYIYDTLTDARDGKKYKTVSIDNQIWMAENIAYRIPKECWAYNNDENNIVLYGYLYVWKTANTVCPKGWHLPTVQDWTILALSMGGDTIAGNNLKEIGTIHWTSPNIDATNAIGFTALPGGYRNTYGTLEEQGNSGFWWTATEYNSSNAWNIGLHFDNSNVHFDTNDKKIGMSVRCVKN